MLKFKRHMKPITQEERVMKFEASYALKLRQYECMSSQCVEVRLLSM